MSPLKSARGPLGPEKKLRALVEAPGTLRAAPKDLPRASQRTPRPLPGPLGLPLGPPAPPQRPISTPSGPFSVPKRPFSVPEVQLSFPYFQLSVRKKEKQNDVFPSDAYLSFVPKEVGPETTIHKTGGRRSSPRGVFNTIVCYII